MLVSGGLGFIGAHRAFAKLKLFPTETIPTCSLFVFVALEVPTTIHCRDYRLVRLSAHMPAANRAHTRTTRCLEFSSQRAGSHTSVCLVQAGARVTIVDDLSNSFIEVLNRLEKLLGPLFSRITFKQVRYSGCIRHPLCALQNHRMHRWVHVLPNSTASNSQLT